MARDRSRSGSLFGQPPPRPTPEEVDATIFGELATQDRQRALSRATVSGSSMQIGAFRFEPTRLDIDERTGETEWALIGETLLFMGRGAQWWIGDWLAFGDRVWGKTYREVAAQTGYSAKTLREYAYVARQVDSSIRMDNLTFRHHQLVAGLESDEQLRWLALASENDWTVAQMQKAMKPRLLPADPIERQFEGMISYGIRLGQGDQRRYVDALRRAADQIERSWET